MGSVVDKVSNEGINEMMSNSESQRLEQTAEMMKAIGHAIRLAMLEQLRDKPWSVCELAAHLGLNKSVASKHLSTLCDTGLLTMEQKGTQVIYTWVAPCVVEMTQCAHKAVTAHKIQLLQASLQPTF